MTEGAEDLDLAFEADYFLGAAERAFAHDLDRDLALGREVYRLVDDALAAAVDLTDDLITREGVRGELGGGLAAVATSSGLFAGAADKVAVRTRSGAAGRGAWERGIEK